ncbi:MAG: hypothetical protein HYZ54_04175 [Ignavibacteriae bacterium]|nr:hypothetical protein [Ignavibacteriota bacterium]
MTEIVSVDSITTNKIADGSIILDILSIELQNEKELYKGLVNSATGAFAFIGSGDASVASSGYTSITGDFTNKTCFQLLLCMSLLKYSALTK